MITIRWIEWDIEKGTLHDDIEKSIKYQVDDCKETSRYCTAEQVIVSQRQSLICFVSIFFVSTNKQYVIKHKK